MQINSIICQYFCLLNTISPVSTFVVTQYGRSNMADKENVSEFLRFQSQILSKWGGAAKIVSFLDKTNGAGLHYLQDCRTPQPYCKEKWRIQYG